MAGPLSTVAGSGRARGAKAGVPAQNGSIIVKRCCRFEGARRTAWWTKSGLCDLMGNWVDKIRTLRLAFVVTRGYSLVSPQVYGSSILANPCRSDKTESQSPASVQRATPPSRKVPISSRFGGPGVCALHPHDPLLLENYFASNSQPVTYAADTRIAANYYKRVPCSGRALLRPGSLQNPLALVTAPL